MGNYSYIPISGWQLGLSLLLIIIPGTISALLKLGLIKSLLWGTIRAFIQLTLIGYVLTIIFNINNLMIIIITLVFMCGIASFEAINRNNFLNCGFGFISFISLSASTLLVGLVVIMLVISPNPWYSPQVAIPIFGMILGNSMNAISLSLERMHSEIYSHFPEIEQMLSFGATPWEATNSYIRKAVIAGMTPTINALMVVGLVSLPGMMTGQILAGMNPQDAVRYQFVVLVMITAAVAIGCLLLVGLAFGKFFNEENMLIRQK